MPRARRDERQKAFDLWLKSGGERPLKEIADELGVSVEQVRSWKSVDKWVKRTHLVEDKKSGELVLKRRAGPPPGSKNGKGHGAPAGNKNNFRHGAYERAMLKILDGDEAAAFQDIAVGDDLALELRKELATLTVRELRLNTHIAELKELHKGEKGVQLLEGSTTVDYWEETGVFRDGVKVEGTGFYDGKMSKTTTVNKVGYIDALTKLESELDHVHGRKLKLWAQLETLQTNRERLDLERQKLAGETEQSKLANAWVAALLGKKVEGEDEDEEETDEDADDSAD